MLFSNLNLGIYLLVEKVASPSINPASQNLVIIILSLIELGIHLPDISLISFLSLIISNLLVSDNFLLSLLSSTALEKETK
jgi:hypothetical protein